MNWPDFGMGATVVAAFGLSVTGSEFWVGLAMGVFGAFAAAFILRAGMVDNAKSLSIFGTLLVGLFFSIVAAQAREIYLPEWSIGLVMSSAGFLSSFIGPAVLKIASVVSGSIPEIVNRLIQRRLPRSDQSKDP